MTAPAAPRRGPAALAAALASATLLGACAIAPALPDAEPVPPAPIESVAVPVTATPAPVEAPPAPAAAVEAAPAAVTISDEIPFRGRLDPADDAARGDLWERVRRGFSMPEIEGELVRKWELWYASRPDYVQRMTERGGRYLFHIVEEVERRGMPSELALLPFVESAFNPQALSVARAAGMWQFMPGTGRDYELRQNVFRDDRRDVLASTRAALDYLQRLHDQFGDWQLALAAYNWGQGNVQRAVALNRKAGRATNYEVLRMPAETRNYVPKLQAVKNIVQRPAAFGLVLPDLHDHPFFLSVAIERDIDLALAASLSGLSIDEFQALNPQHNKPVILAAGSPQVLLPYDNANHFLRTIERHRGPMASWTAWVAPKTLKPSEAAQKVGMTEADLREVNRIPPKMLVKAGSTLLVPRAAHATLDVAEQIADNAMIALAPDGPSVRKVVVKAGRKGDTVAAVARRYRVSPAQVAAWNGVPVGASFRPGEAITVMLAAAPARHATTKPGRRATKPAAPPRTRVAAGPPRQSAR